MKASIDSKGVQSFFGKINFVCRFILDYASTVKPITKFLRKDKDFKWTFEAQRAFTNIKATIISSLVLVSPNFDNIFIMYSFSSKDTITVMLTEKNSKGEEFPISFMRKELHDYELRCSHLGKQYFALIRVVSHFIHYILNNLVKYYIPWPLIKMILN